VYSRITLLELDPIRFDVDDAVARLEALVVPALQEQPGYEGAIVLANDDAKGIVITLWATREAADAGLASGFWAAQVGRFATLFRAAPGREGYDVVYADTPLVAGGAGRAT
jgi:heme-degrading monooxygenase HmoA